MTEHAIAPPLKANEYQCAHCLGIFQYAWSEQEAQDEAKRNGFNHRDCAVICDDCYQAFRKRVLARIP